MSQIPTIPLTQLDDGRGNVDPYKLADLAGRGSPTPESIALYVNNWNWALQHPPGSPTTPPPADPAWTDTGACVARPLPPPSGDWTRTGTSPTVRDLLTAIGAVQIAPGGGSIESGGFLRRFRGMSEGNLAVVGFRLVPSPSQDYNPIAVGWLGGPDKTPQGGHNILVEGMRFDRMFRGCDFQGLSDDLRINRCVFVDPGSTWTSGYSPAATHIGLCAGAVSTSECYVLSRFYTTGVRGAWVQDSAHYRQEDMDPGTFVEDADPVVVIQSGPASNWASCAGTQLRCNHRHRRGVYHGCHTALDMGQAGFAGGVGGSIEDTVVLQGRDLDASPVNRRCTGVLISNSANHTISGLIFSGKAAEAGLNAAAINWDCSNRGSVVNQTVSGCIVRDWCRAVFVQRPAAGFTLGGQLTRGQYVNTIAGETLPLVEVVTGGNVSVGYSGNRYFDVRGQGVFLVDGVARDFAWWKANMEPDAVWGDPGWPDPGRSLARYAGTLGLPATLDAAVDAMAAQSRQAWDPHWAPRAVAAYLRGGFGR